MNQSSSDPFRYLKRLKNKTPSKRSKQSSQTNILMSSRIQGQSRLEETALLKQNCYDPNKYYSSKCQEYLRKINYQQDEKESPEFLKEEPQSMTPISVFSNIKGRSKTVQSQDSLKEVLFSKEKEMSKEFIEDVQVLTFKKIHYQDQSGSESGKRMIQFQRQLEFDMPADPFLSTEQQSQPQLLECPVCSRKFNPASYEKHVRVCETVFIKKRKRFSSQKQRSKSKQKK